MSCKYCDNSFILKENSEVICHRPFHLEDSNYKRIKANGEKPLTYLEECINTKTHIWQMVTEINNEYKDELRVSVIYCPRCGQKLVGFNSTLLDKEA